MACVIRQPIFLGGTFGIETLTPMSIMVSGCSYSKTTLFAEHRYRYAEMSPCRTAEENHARRAHRRALRAMRWRDERKERLCGFHACSGNLLRFQGCEQ